MYTNMKLKAAVSSMLLVASVTIPSAAHAAPQTCSDARAALSSALKAQQICRVQGCGVTDNFFISLRISLSRQWIAQLC